MAKSRLRIARSNRVAHRQRDDPIAPSNKVYVRRNEEISHLLFGQGREGRIEFASLTQPSRPATFARGHRPPLARPLHLPWRWDYSDRSTCATVSAVGERYRSAFPAVWRPSSLTKKLTPVALPPGRSRLATSPDSIGSPPVTNTIGSAAVARLAASAEAVDVAQQYVDLTTNQIACQFGSRSVKPSAER